jgi:hypothetical protein
MSNVLLVLRVLPASLRSRPSHYCQAFGLPTTGRSSLWVCEKGSLNSGNDVWGGSWNSLPSGTTKRHPWCSLGDNLVICVIPEGLPDSRIPCHY